MSWRNVVDTTKRSPFLLRVADRLGRGRGRLRVFDHIGPPPRAPLVPDLSGWADHDFAAAWLGHATVLLRVGGKTILTDPVFFNRVGIGLGLMTGGPRRLVAAAVAVKRLPPLDLILISHAHFDHLDRPTLGRLDKSVPVITASHTADLISDLGYKNVTELKWGQATTVRWNPGLGNTSDPASSEMKITAHEVAHWGARTFYDRHRGYNSYLIETAGRRVLYGGDTAYFEGFADIAPVDLAILGIGAYDPYIAAHATPEQAADMARQAQATWLMPIHHSTFRLSHEPTREPIQRLLKAFDPERIIARDVGQVWVSPAS